MTARIEIIIVGPISESIRVEIQTNKYDMGTYKRKFGSTLMVVGDQYPEYAPPAPIANQIAVSWTDDDYNTYTDPIYVDLTTDYPTIKQLGQFRRRAFRLIHTENAPLRLESLEISYKEGEH